jgi:hypothetical protein
VRLLHGGIGYKTPDQIWQEENISIPYKTTQPKLSEKEENLSTKCLYSDGQFVQLTGV